MIPGRIEMSTCIIAANCKNGMIMVADRRETNGYEVFEEDKIYAIPREDPLIITGFSGWTGIRDKFIPFVTRAIRNTLKKEEVIELEDLILPIEETIKMLRDRYSERLTGGRRTPIIHALVIGRERIREGQPKMYKLHEEGYAEQCRDIACAGSAGPYANFILRLIRPKPRERSVEEMLGIASRIILFIQTMEIDINVGGEPQGATIQGRLKVIPNSEMMKYVGLTSKGIAEAMNQDGTTALGMIDRPSVR